MKNKLFNKTLILVLLGLSIFTLGFKESIDKPNYISEERRDVRAVFSWNDFQVKKGRTELFETMDELSLNTVYQEFSKNLKPEEIDSFLVDASSREVSVSLLAGSANWALDRDGKAMIDTIDRVIQMNKSLEKSDGIKSILFDVEPYILEEWNEKSKKKIMSDFVRGMRLAYNKAHKNDLEVIVCIPFYYDNMGLSRQLENLIKSGCDSIAIMNYFKTNEAINISNEVKLADKYGKKVINIYELQPPGVHGLEEKNTYYNQGILEVEKSFAKIRQQLPDRDISVAFHEYRSLREILER